MKHILIVDDLPDHLMFAGAILKQEGYQVHAAASGDAALQFLEQRLPDLIVLDILMKDMNGLEVCRRIKADERTREIPVIFVTTETDPDVIAAGFEAGCCDYVRKPFLKVEYLARISTHLKIAEHTQKLAEANDELNRFCSAVSHDLKSPLSVIQMLIAALKDELGNNLNGEAEKIAGMLDDKTGQLILMVNRLLEFSRMCNIKPFFRELDLTKIVQETFEDYRMMESGRRVTLLCGILPTVYGDEVLVEQVIKNVMSNAFKFTRKRENAVITVSAECRGRETEICIRDNGAGFEMEYADRLFGIFQRLHRQEEYEGTGVGLAMVDRIMRRHGGSVRIEGKPDEGAAVFLAFPNETEPEDKERNRLFVG